ncbi:MAG: hypothetical protein HY619_02075 [Thaumarchaeota archaeon]|nr:hypothetical protein [Nitrososphaerota archaeon]
MPSIRVSLDFISQYDLELLKRIPDYDGLLRLIASAIFKSPSEWTEPQDAIVDTGAHTSILPKWLWTRIEKRVITSYYVRGLVPDPKCQMKVSVAWISGLF